MSEKPSLLFLCQRIPYPPDKGEKIRAWRILDHLSRHFSVYLGCFIDDERDWAHTDIVAGRCTGTYFARLDPRRARLRCLGGLVSGEALSLPYFYDRALAAWTEKVLQTRRPEAIFVYSSAITAGKAKDCWPSIALLPLLLRPVYSLPNRKQLCFAGWCRRRRKRRWQSPMVSMRIIFPPSAITRKSLRPPTVRSWFSPAPWITGPMWMQPSGSPMKFCP